MLVVKVLINDRPIDEIWVQNMHQSADGIYVYKIRKPEGYEGRIVLHKRKLGYQPLLASVMNILVNEKPFTVEKEKEELDRDKKR